MRTEKAELKKGDIVRPACDGETIRWTALRGRVVDTWMDGKELRAEVRWFNATHLPYGRFLPAYLLVRACR